MPFRGAAQLNLALTTTVLVALLPFGCAASRDRNVAARTSQAASSQTTATEATMKDFVYFVEPTREGFMEQSTPDEDRIVGQHFEYLKDLLAKGRLVLAGRCLDGPPGIVVFEAADEWDAQWIMLSDPAVAAGVFKATLHPYRVALLRGRGE